MDADGAPAGITVLPEIVEIVAGRPLPDVGCSIKGARGTSRCTAERPIAGSDVACR
jgi:hypothetical protein